MSNRSFLNVIEKARKSAGMDAFERDVPQAHERGAKYWAKFVASVRSHVESIVDELVSCQQAGRKAADDKAELAAELATLREEAFGKLEEKVSDKLTIVTQQLNLSEEQQRRILSAVSSS